jgi:hypothetical protein
MTYNTFNAANVLMLNTVSDKNSRHTLHSELAHWLQITVEIERQKMLN